MCLSSINSPSIMYVTHDVGFFVSHRMAVAVAAKNSGYNVSVVGPKDSNVNYLKDNGLRHISMEMPRGIKSPLQQIRSAWQLFNVLRNERPTLLHLIASKPIIIGGLIGRFLKIPSVAAISGLGHLFIDADFITKMSRQAILVGYRMAISHPRCYPIFQNRTNRGIFEELGIIDNRATMIYGSGTDLAKFDPSPSTVKKPTVLLPARMLWTKGVREFCEAAKILLDKGYNAKFLMVGDPYVGNPASIWENQMHLLLEQYPVDWKPHQKNIASVMKESHIIVLPSYSEGFPKTLIDAAAAGRPTVTSDIAGCRDAIEEGLTGLLCDVRNSESLARQIGTLLDDPQLCKEMGKQGRLLAEKKYAIEKIQYQHLTLYDRIVSTQSASVSDS